MPWGSSMWQSAVQTDPFAELVMVDYGDIPVDPNSIEASLPSIRSHVREVAETGAIPFMIGGNHAVLYPHALGVADVRGRKDFSIIHIDAHTDMSSENFGHHVNIGNMVRLSVEEGIVDGTNMLQPGQRSPAYGPDRMNWYREHGVRVYFQPAIERRGFRTVLDPAVAGGVTAPVNGGWTTRELMQTLKAVVIAAEVVGIDFVEDNPFVDDHARTSGLVTSQLMRETLAAIALRNKGITDPFYFHPDTLGGTRR